MATLATWVVPPMYEAQLHGVSAVVISARKISLLDLSGRVLGAVTHCKRDAIADTRPFGELVAFVRSKIVS